MKEELLVTGEIYHVHTKSIAGFRIFNNDADFLRIIRLMQYYQKEKQRLSFSKFIREDNQSFKNKHSDSKKLVQIICHSPMPTHLHLALKQLEEKGISVFMSNILNSYSRYFNLKHHRKGPLWEGRFKKVLVETDSQLLHLTRYIHLNPVTANLVNRPEDWVYSSYKEYISNDRSSNAICNYDDILEMEPSEYKKFVEDRISYQKELAKIKNLLLE